MKTVFVNAIKEGDAFDSVFHLTEITKKETKSNKDYWILTLQDKTGSISAKVWDTSAWGDLAEAGSNPVVVARGDYVKVRAEASSYKGKVDLTIRKIRRLDTERDGADFTYDDFVPVRDGDRFQAMIDLQGLYEHRIKHPGLKAACLAVFKDAYLHMALRDAPAASEIHQPYIGGLVEHIEHLNKLIAQISFCYMLSEDSLDLLRAAALFHDIGKTVELKWKTGIGYTDEGSLIGHVGISMEILEHFKPFYWEAVGEANDIQPEGWKRQLDRHSNLWMHLRHLVASHHGQLEWRAIAKPQSREATLFHLIDMMDSKMGMFDQIEKTATFDEDGFGGWNSRLEGRPWKMPE